MFAPEIKSNASSIAVSTCWIVDFGVTKAFLPMASIFGDYGNFFIFSGFCMLAFVFVVKQLFETKGLTLSQIQEKLNTSRD
jgi:Sugar (and other) transporter